MTQAHVPVLLAEALTALNIEGTRRAGAYLDATFGRGGHSRAILDRLGETGRLVALDRDPEAIAAGANLGDRRFQLRHAPFSALAEQVELLGMPALDGVLFDLGVSSPQIDQAARGFSFMADGPLDMRMDTTRSETAAQWLAQVSEGELATVIGGLGEERFAKQIAGALVAARRREPIRTTGQLARLVASAVPTREPGQHPATRTFQAVRLHVNQELAQLEIGLEKAFALLGKGGRMVVISFHSLEDRKVKHFMRDRASAARLPRHLPVRAAEIAPPEARLIGRAVKPSDAEVTANPRARSAVLRVLERS